MHDFCFDNTLTRFCTFTLFHCFQIARGVTMHVFQFISASFLVVLDFQVSEKARCSVFHVVGGNRQQSFEDFIPTALSQIMRKCAVEITTDGFLPPAAYRQIKQHPHDAVVVFVTDANAFKRFIEIIRAKRILGPDTKVVIFVDEIFGIFEIVWERLRVGNAIVGSQDRKGIQFHYQKNWTNHLKMLALRFDEPLVILPKDGENLDGVCIRLVRTIASSLNLKLTESIYPENETYLPYESKGRKFAGFLELLNNHQTDIVCGSLSLDHIYYHATEALPCYAIENAAWFVGRRKISTVWKGIIQGFSPTVWMFGIATFVFTCFVVYRVSNDSLQRIVLNVFALLVSYPALQSFVCDRRFLFIIILYSFIVSSAYTSVFISFLTAPGVPVKIASVNSAYKSGFTFLFQSLSKPYTLHRNPIAQQLLKENRLWFLENTRDILEILKNNESTISLIPYNDAQLIILRDFRLGDFYTLDEKWNNQERNVYMSPNNQFFRDFVRKQSSLIESGIVGAWFQQIFGKIAIKSEVNSSKRITIRHLIGVLYVYLIAIFAAICIFFAEIFVKIVLTKLFIIKNQ